MKFLLEIGCEELPASAVQTACDFLPKQFESELKKERISIQNIRAFATPRRLVISADNLDAKQEDICCEITGPSAKIAFDSNKNLTKAGAGFLKSKKIDPKEAYTKDSPKGPVLAAKYHETGKATSELLLAILPKLLTQIPFKKTMRWDNSGARFIRPVRWLLCLLNNQVVPFQFGTLLASNKTCGHRFIKADFSEISASDYFEFLNKHSVMLDGQERKQLILEQSQKLAQSVGGFLHEDSKLLNTVTNLVEKPWPVLGEFDKKYLKIPQEILISEMREHQKYFSITDKSGKLMPYFIVVSGSPVKNPENLAAGNARVLKARFEDGTFYYKKDLEKPLVDFVDKKPEDIIHWVNLLAKLLDAKDLSKLEHAAYLCKADLNTGVVGEFPELQGLIGGIYAEKSGEDKKVCQAIKEHYWPRFSADKTPNTQMGSILSIADRLANLHNRKLPKGSADPYGLRRAAIGLAKIILDLQKPINLEMLIKDKAILDFINSRARGVFLEKHSVLAVDSTFEAANFDLCAWRNRIHALEKFDYKDVSAVFKRVKNISAKANLSSNTLNLAQLALLKEPSEKALISAINQIDLKEDLDKILADLAKLKPVLADFFDNIMVMVENKALSEARLTLLASVQNKAAYIADFSKLAE